MESLFLLTRKHLAANTAQKKLVMKSWYVCCLINKCCTIQIQKTYLKNLLLPAIYNFGYICRLMKLLIKKAKIIAPQNALNGKVRDIYIVNGIITKIAATVTEKADTIIAAKDLCVSAGWVDIFSHFCDPGMEYRETIETGAAAAAAGGFTDVFVLPNNNPVTHAKPQVEYIKSKGAHTPVTLHPIGAVTKGTEGAALSEMYDMHTAGAVAFSDGTASIQSTAIVLKTLQYLKAINATLIQLPDDISFAPTGLINEGIISTQLGLPGKPAVAEELIIARDIELAKYTNAKIHFTGVSTKKGIDLIAAAKKQGVQVTCSVTPYHLFFTDVDLINYDTNLKVNPVLRTKADKDALIKAIQNGIVDCIAAHHIPQNWDAKTCEFEYAKNGMVGLETVYQVLQKIGIHPTLFVQMQAFNTRQIFNLPQPIIKEQQTAVLTLFTDSNEEVVIEKNHFKSLAYNSAFIGQTLKGKVVGIINGTKTFFN
jgi:dihydroorotase